MRFLSRQLLFHQRDSVLITSLRPFHAPVYILLQTLNHGRRKPNHDVLGLHLSARLSLIIPNNDHPNCIRLRTLSNHNPSPHPSAHLSFPLSNNATRSASYQPIPPHTLSSRTEMTGGRPERHHHQLQLTRTPVSRAAKKTAHRL